jgi:hypothetical protein
VVCITATEGFNRSQATLLALLIRRHLSHRQPLPVLAMLRLTQDVLTAWVEALTHPAIPPPAAVRWGCLLALS